MPKYRKYNINTQTYRISTNVPIMLNCNGYTFTNIGGVICRVNGMVVFPAVNPLTTLGDSRSVGGNEGEVYKGNIEVIFDAGAGALIEIVQKTYIDQDND